MRIFSVAFLVGCGAAASGGARMTSPIDATTTEAIHPHGRLAIGDGFGCALLSSGPTCWGTPPFDGADPAGIDVLGNAVELDAFGPRLCARSRAGDVRCWDQDGAMLVAPSMPPAQRVWAWGPCALSHDGEVWCWNTSRAAASFDSANGMDDGTGDDEAEARAPAFARIATMPGAIDLVDRGASSFVALDGSGRLALWSGGQVQASAVIEGARSLTLGRDGAEVLVQLDDDRFVRARFDDGADAMLSPGPSAIDIAYPYEQLCMIDRPDHAACFRYGDEHDPVPVELIGPQGMLAIAASETQACVLTRDDEVYCVDIRLPPRIVELTASSTGLSEQGSTIWAERAPWTAMLEHGGPAEWPAREEGCVGGSWIGFSRAPDPDALGWVLCGDVLSVAVEVHDAREVRVVPGVRRVFGSQGRLSLSMRDDTTRVFFTDSSWGEYGTLSPPLEGFSRLRDFDEGVTHRCGVTAGGAVRCRIADPNVSSAAFDVAGITGAQEVETAHDCACARTASGAVQCADFDGGRVVGPVRDAALGDGGIVELAGNDQQICARSSDGHLWCASDRFMPIPAAEPPTASAHCGAFVPTILDDVVDIEAGTRALCARQSTGRVLCWGDTHAGVDARDVEARLAPDRTPIRVAP